MRRDERGDAPAAAANLCDVRGAPVGDVREDPLLDGLTTRAHVRPAAAPDGTTARRHRGRDESRQRVERGAEERAAARDNPLDRFDRSTTTTAKRLGGPR